MREGRIPSRLAGTDRAIVEAILARRPGRVLDAGCGEGWLIRALAGHGVTADGFDAESELINAARAQSPSARLWVERFGEGGGEARYDVVALNFALLGEELVEILRALSARLTSGGAIIIQTLHPANVDRQQEEGWRRETFAALADGLGQWDPMPWYFRTADSWRAAVAEAGLRVAEIFEPLHPETRSPLSLLIVAES